MDRLRPHRFPGALLCVLSALFALSGGCRRAPPPVTDADALALFGRVAGVLRHARCLSCHGGRDLAAASAGHPGGPVPYEQAHQGVGCAACHDAASTSAGESAWRLPLPEHAFTDKTDAQLCLQFREAFPGLPHDPSDLMQHIDYDERIRLAFDGRRAILPRAQQSALPPEPPPMTREQFSAAVRDWAVRGRAGCGPGARR
jgi:hypothetical protein